MSIHPSAIVGDEATIHPTVSIGPHAVIDGPVSIAAHCRIAAGAVVMGHTEIGAGTRIHAHAVIGDVPQDRAFEGGVSFCRIGENCALREGVTVHRGTTPGSRTVIGDRCLLMTNSHVAHNCELGDDVTLVSGALLGGYVQVGNKAIISGNAGVHQFVRIGELAIVTVLAKVVKDVPPFFMTDQSGAVVAENRVGLARAGFSIEERAEIKLAHRILYRSGMHRDDAIRALAESATTAAGRRLLDFMKADSDRGIARQTLGRRAA